MRSAFLAGLVLAAFGIGSPVFAQASAPSGEAVYKQHCAACHEGSIPRMPTREALRGMTPEHVETSLSSFTMRRQGAALSAAERRAVAAFVTGRPAGSYRAPLDVIPKTAYCSAAVSGNAAALTGPSWNGWGINAQNTRFQSAQAAGVSAADVPRLKLKWAFGLPGVSASGSQISVVGNRVFVGSRNGLVYALDAKTGCLVWAVEADAAVRSTPVVVPSATGRSMVYFGDAHAQVYGVDAATGAVAWKTKIEDHLDAIITGGAAYANGRLYVPVSSMEEGSATIATYQCCTFRGSVAAIDAATGKQIWKTYTIPEAPQPTTRSSRGTQLHGPSGGGVWSTPALEPARNRLYIATGDAYSQPAARTTDAIMALAMDTGRIEWVRQTLAGDAWTTACFGADSAGRDNCPEKARTGLRLRQRARAGDAARWPATGGRGTEVGPVARRQRRYRGARVDGAGGARRHPRRHRVGVRGRWHHGLRVAVQRARRKTRRGGGPARGEPGRRQDTVVRTTGARDDVRREARMHHGPTGRRQRDARRGLLGGARRSPARLRRRPAAR